MATTTERSAPATPPRSPRIPKIGRDRPAGGFELWLWLFMRISGIVLILLAVGHVLIMHIPDGGVSRIDFGFVQTRWQSPFWRTWDWMLLSLALVHGVNGLRNITLDYVRPARGPVRDQHGLLRARVRAVRAGDRGRVHVRPERLAAGGLT